MKINTFCVLILLSGCLWSCQFNYEDTTIFNQLHIDNVPTDSDNTWQFKIVQFQPRTERIASLMWLFVNANNGEIRIWDIPKDTIIPLDTWLRMRTKRQQ